MTGLNAPKGLALHDGKLYAADIDKLVVVDTESGKIVATYDAIGAAFLNDVTAADDGRVFVSDTVKNQIWMLDGPLFQLWLEDPALQNPNGLLAEPDRLLVAAWGEMNPQGLLDEGPGPSQGGRLPDQEDHRSRHPADRQSRRPGGGRQGRLSWRPTGSRAPSTGSTTAATPRC